MPMPKAIVATTMRVGRGHEPVLHRVPLLGLQAGVVGLGRQPALGQALGHLLGGRCSVT